MKKRVGQNMQANYLQPLNGILFRMALHVNEGKKDKPPKAKWKKQHGGAILTEVQIREIVERRSRGQTMGKISKETGIPYGRVAGVLDNGIGCRTFGL